MSYVPILRGRKLRFLSPLRVCCLLLALYYVSWPGPNWLRCPGSCRWIMLSLLLPGSPGNTVWCVCLADLRWFSAAYRIKSRFHREAPEPSLSPLSNLILQAWPIPCHWMFCWSLSLEPPPHPFEFLLLLCSSAFLLHNCFIDLWFCG